MIQEQIIEIQTDSEECMKLCSSENRHTGVKGGLNNNKRKDISKITRNHYRLQK